MKQQKFVIENDLEEVYNAITKKAKGEDWQISPTVTEIKQVRRKFASMQIRLLRNINYCAELVAHWYVKEKHPSDWESLPQSSLNPYVERGYKRMYSWKNR